MMLATTRGRPLRHLAVGTLLVAGCSSESPASNGTTGTLTGGTATVTASSTGSGMGGGASSMTAGPVTTAGPTTSGTASTSSSVGGATASSGSVASSSSDAATLTTTGQGGSAASNSSTDGSSAGGGTAGNGGTGMSEPCPMPALSAGNSNRTVDVGGVERSFILHVPESYTGMDRVPLVLDFHALGGSGSQEQSGSGYQRVADQEGFLIAFPNGIDNAWNIGPCCTNSRDVDDLGFAKAMVDTISAEGCVDSRRVYATGVSMGGGMSHHLACNSGNIFAAVTPAAFDLLVPEEQPCAPSRPISVLAFRGTQDTVVPYAGGPGPSGRITFLGAQGSFERWAELNGCTAATVEDGGCTYYKECDAGVEVGLCVAQGGGHAAGDADVGWEFLSRFTLP